MVIDMNGAKELEDYLELQEPGLKAQIQESTAEYRRGKARLAAEFLAALRKSENKSRKRLAPQ
jgi:hypothetical protein